jgi:hypothetical protein
MELASNVAHLYNQAKRKPDALFVDVVGLGAGVADRLIQLGVPVIEVNGAAKSDKDEYANKRAEMYFNLRDYMKKNKAHMTDDLEEELMAVEYEFNSREKIQLVSKKKIKEILGRSPDKADSFAMHFAYPVQKMDDNLDTIQYEGGTGGW